MALHDLQMALGMMVVARASGSKLSTDLSANLSELNLTNRELDWLDILVGSPGFDVTCYIQQWWRQTRLLSTLKLTLAALGSKQIEEFLQAYFAATPCSSMFLIQEALDFLDFVIEVAPPIPHLDAIARFERAILLAASVTDMSFDFMLDIVKLPPAQQMRYLQASSIVELTAPPEILLSALLFGCSLPPVDSQRFPLIVAPWLPQLWRPATKEEVRQFEEISFHKL